MNTPSSLFYTESDEWIRLESDGTVTVGITDYAQSELGEIVYVELPEVGQNLAVGASFGVVESVKAVGELHCPIAGEVTAINGETVDTPSLVNQSPYQEGWLIQIRTAGAPDTSGLMDAAAYEDFRS